MTGTDDTTDRDEATGRLLAGHGLAHLGGEARQAHRLESLAEFVAQLPGSWRCAEDVMRHLETVGQMSARGLLPGSQAGAAVRSAEVWVKAETLKLDRDRMAALEAQIGELKRELASSRRPRVV
jgi:hypothetical protein